MEASGQKRVGCVIYSDSSAEQQLYVIGQGNWFQFGAISLVDVSLSIHQKLDKIPFDIMLVAR